MNLRTIVPDLPKGYTWANQAQVYNRYDPMFSRRMVQVYRGIQPNGTFVIAYAIKI